MRVEILLAASAYGDRPVRRMGQLETMMRYFNPGYNTVKHMAYGCNCNMLVGDRPMSQPGVGQPIDELDATCKVYKSCQKCVMEKHGDSCIGEFTDYRFSISTAGTTCNNEPGSCARALCECDAEFALAHSTKVSVFNQDFNHVFGMFKFEEICPDICGKDSFQVSNTEAYNIDDHFNGRYVSAHKLVNGRKCYRQNDSLIQWELDNSGNGRWVMRDTVGVKLYSRTNVPCPHLAEWEIEPATEFTGSDSEFNGSDSDFNGSASEIEFNGFTKTDVVVGRPESDEQCCTPDSGSFQVYNAVTHVCCTDGSVTSNGNC